MMMKTTKFNCMLVKIKEIKSKIFSQSSRKVFVLYVLKSQ